MILPSWHDVGDREPVIEEVVSHGLPGALDRIMLGDNVVQPVIFFLIWRGSPGNGHCS